MLLSAAMAGLVYTRRERRDGPDGMRGAFLARALKIYACQAALLLFLMTAIATVGWITGQEAIRNLISFYLDRPLTALASGLLLVYSPPLLDILPMYVLFMLVSPLVLLHGLHRGWGGLLAVSAALWLGAQLHLGRELYELLSAFVPIPVPYRETGAFEILAWQFLWMLGLWMGSMAAERPDDPPVRFPRGLVAAAAAIALVGFVWRHGWGQVPFQGDPVLEPLFDKWHLGPLRLLDFLALLVLVLHFGPWLKARLPRVAALEMLGQASLPVFCTHLVLALLALAIVGEWQPARPLWADLLILGGTFAVLFAVAWASRRLDEQAARLQQRIRNRKGPRRPSGPRRAPAPPAETADDRPASRARAHIRRRSGAAGPGRTGRRAVRRPDPASSSTRR